MKKIGLLCWMLVTLSLLTACDVFVSVKTRLHRADSAVADNDYGRAIVELRNVLQSEPDNLQARIKLVEALLLNSDIAALDNETARLAAQGDKSPAVPVLLARVYLAKRDFNGLLTALDGHQLRLDAMQERLYRAQALLGLQKNPDAQAVLQDVLREHPDDAELQVVYAKALAAAGDVTQSLAMLDKLLAAHPNDARAWAATGYLQATQGRSLDATRALASANRHAGGQLTRTEELSLLALLVEQQLLSGNLKAAQTALKQLTGFFPRSPVAALASSEVNFAAANYAEVVPQMQTLLASQSELHAARLLLGRALAAQGNQRQAETELQRVVSAMPRNGMARLSLAQVQLKLGENREALETLAPLSGEQQAAPVLNQAQAAVVASAKDVSELLAASKRQPGNEPLRVVTASTLLRANQPGAAVALLRDMQQGPFSPSRVPVLLKALSMQSPNEVRSEADRIAAQYARDPAYLVGIGTYFAAEKDYATARAWYERALAAVRAAQPDATRPRAGELPVLRELIALDLADGNKTPALARAQDARTRYPQSGDAALLQADLLMQLGDAAAAKREYEALYDRIPSAPLAIKLAKAGYAAGEAMPFAVLTQWLERYPDDVTARLALADAYLAAKQAPAAIGQYEQVIDAQPVNVTALNNLAWLYQQAGDKRAESTARKAYALAPASPVITDTLGWILMKDGKAEEALKLLGDAAAKSQQPDIQYHYAAALSQAGKQAEARERLQTLLAQHPQFEARSQAEQALKQLNATTP